MSIPNDPLAMVAKQDIVNLNNIRAVQTSFNTSFGTKNMANFYAIDSSFSLACHYSEKNKNLIIKDRNSQLPDDLVPAQE